MVTGKFKAWLMAVRPKTLPVGVAPIVVGWAVAYSKEPDGLNNTAVGVAALVAVLLQVGANLANDLFDYKKGTDNSRRRGPTRVTQAKLLTSSEVATGTFLVLLLAVLAGSYLVWVGGWPIGALGAAAVASALAYTGGPLPLGYLGLGDLFVFIFFGLAGVCGTAFLAVGHIPSVAWLAAVATGLLSVNLLVVNNIRDLKSDSESNKRTLPVRFGEKFAFLQYAASLFAAYLCVAGILILLPEKRFLLLSLLTLPFACWNLWSLFKSRDTETLISLLGRSSLFALLFAVLLSAGLMI